MSENQASFFDAKTIFAIILVGLVWFTWEKHLQEKYPESYKQKTVPQQTVAAKVENAPALISEEGGAPVVQKIEKKETEALTHYSDAAWEFDISSVGMGIKSLMLKQLTERTGHGVELGIGDGRLAFETEVIDQPKALNFKVVKKNENTFEGIAEYGGGTITKIVTVDSNKFTVQVKVRAVGVNSGFKGFLTYVPERVAIPEQKGFFQRIFFPRYDISEYVAIDGKDVKRQVFMDGATFTSESYKAATQYSFGSHYFAIAFIDRSSIIPHLKVDLDRSKNQVLGALSHEVINPSNVFEIEYLGYAGPKSLDLLKSVDERLPDIINFGVFGFLSRPMLKIMKGFYSLFGNWGLAIIFLTLMVRLFVLPFNIMSYKSIKAMQKIQPILKQLQEKYKDDRQELNLQTMKLMRENKVNPLGGCLPMLLQIPVFFALYQVFGQSIELYKAPFFLWIHDLSLKDPYYVLPLGMAVTMFFQQKMTPTTTMDPAQQKVMLFMPVLFSMMMLNLPAALNLYIFVSSLFAVTQQLLFMRDKIHNPVILTTKAKLVEK